MDLSAHLPDTELIAAAPGRVNLLGEHVDYNGGPVLPAAIDRTVRLAVRRRDDRLVHLTALDLGQETGLDLDNLAQRQDVHGEPLPDWALYPAGVASILQQAGCEVLGFDGAYTSDVPIGAGLSSSAAVELAFAAAWQALGGWKVDALSLAKLCQKAENQYVGVNCGLMDQFASACGVEDHVLYFDTRNLDWRPVPLPPGLAIVIADSGLRRSLVNSPYNDRRKACEDALGLLRAYLPDIRTLRDVTPQQFNDLAPHLPPLIGARARHVVEECARVDRAVRFLEDGDGISFGRLMIEGHASLRDLYQVSLPEIDRLVELAVRLPGCLGARLTGAGFGGCTVNLVRQEHAQEFIRTLREQYRRDTGLDAGVYLYRASRGAHVIPIFKQH